MRHSVRVNYSAWGDRSRAIFLVINILRNAEFLPIHNNMGFLPGHISGIKISTVDVRKMHRSQMAMDMACSTHSSKCLLKFKLIVRGWQFLDIWIIRTNCWHSAVALCHSSRLGFSLTWCRLEKKESERNIETERDKTSRVMNCDSFTWWTPCLLYLSSRIKNRNWVQSNHSTEILNFITFPHLVHRNIFIDTKNVFLATVCMLDDY